MIRDVSVDPCECCKFSPVIVCLDPVFLSSGCAIGNLCSSVCSLVCCCSLAFLLMLVEARATSFPVRSERYDVDAVFVNTKRQCGFR